jgi:hypothetical protein
MDWSANYLPPTPSHITKEQRREMRREVKGLNFRSWQFWVLGAFFPCLSIIYLLGHEIWLKWPEGPRLVILVCVILCYGAFWLLVVTPTMRRNAMRVWAEHGLCPKCGYDLRGNDSGRCPECGEARGEYGKARQRDIIK